jgi:hypothetical protein
LASACDASPLQSPPKDPRGRVSEETTSMQSSGSLSMLQSHRTITQDRSTWIKPSSLHPTNSIYTPMFPSGTHGNEGNVLSCNCGCQESYIFT